MEITKMIYCYGIIEEDISLFSTGFENNNIYTIRFKDIWAVVSDVSKEQFSQEAVNKNVQNMQWLIEYAPLHENIVTNIVKKTTIVPLKFCTIFKNEKRVKEMLEEKYGAVKENLDRLNGKEEMSLKVFANTDAIKKELAKNSPEIQQLEEEKATKTPGAAYFVQQKIDMLLKDKIQQRVVTTIKEIYSETAKHATDATKNQVLKEKDMVLNAAFLVEKKSLEEFIQEMNIIKEKYPSLQIRITGPFAPYNFVR
jgi:hypothetical protein